LTTSYFAPLELVIDTLHKDVTGLGIQFIATSADAPMLYIEGDGENKDWPPPDNWREILREQAERIGWATHKMVEELAA